ncbi:hypothetical protein [Mycobacteroides abscessus]|uniref:hypothetical protein n=1 Tax=Mycobacteroides abscessus TaxID=36809 RepID=UPI0009A61D81|nr:hypothetical protein [Mycobacteroides abscessus]SLH41467.1 Uncharacterised protein [Mycobacteroides abscessus subsp. massiliense]
MSEAIGHAEVKFSDGRSETFDDVRILSSGVLRVANSVRWVASHGYGSGEGETAVSYYAPGQWVLAKPTVVEGSLFVHDDRGLRGNTEKVIGQEAEPKLLAERVAPRDVRVHVLEYLISVCKLESSAAETAIANDPLTPQVPDRRIRFVLVQAPQSQDSVAASPA